MNLVPTIVDSVEEFCEQLLQHVNKDVFKLDNILTRLTMDIITQKQHCVSDCSSCV